MTDTPVHTTGVTVLGTGGTIACTADADGDLVPTRGIADLLADAGVTGVGSRDILQLDSSTMGLDDLDSLLAEIHRALRSGPVVVTHGTDSMEETAMAVDRLVGGPVFLTGAQRPADDATDAGPDGPTNLRDAVAGAAGTAGAPDVPPAVVFGGRTLPAYGVRKVHTSADAAFDAPSLNRPAPLVPAGSAPPAPPALAGLRVDIVPAYQGADAAAVDAAVASGADGVVIAAFGSGNVGALAPGVGRAVEAGIPVVVSSRVPAGGVNLVYGGPGGGRALQRGGVLDAGELTPPQARMELLCRLAVSRGCAADRPD